MQTTRPLGAFLRNFREAALAAAAAATLAAAPPAAAQDDSVAEQLRRMAERLARLEQRNQELERRLQELQPAATAAQRTATAPAWGDAGRIDSLARDQKALAQRVDDLARQADLVEAGEEAGPKFEASPVGVGQQLNAGGSADGSSATRANYRGDVTVELPAGSIAGAQISALGHVRFGQGEGVALRPTHTATVNSLAFQTGAGADDSFAILAQAHLTFEWSLADGGFNDRKGDRIELSVGKMDVFGFFDQNAVAGDEAAQFLNNAFVHNPLLDSGGDIAADAYGFAPGLRLAYTRVGDGSAQWGASIGMFAAGSGANLSGSLGSPLVIAQLDWSPLQLNGEPRGNYRVYAWSNGRTTGLDGARERHTGVGLSIDQRVGRDWNLFGRAGRRIAGHGTFDSALTLGFEHGGRAWGRARDALGLASGWLRTSDAWRAASADGSVAGYASSRSERLVELYYRMTLNEHLDLSPDFQLVQRPGGEVGAARVRVFGLRAAASF